MTTGAGSDPIADLIEVYVDWRQESAALQDAYERWSSAPEPDQDLAFAAYNAALDREEQASIVYREHLGQIGSRRACPASCTSEPAARLGLDDEAMS